MRQYFIAKANIQESIFFDYMDYWLPARVFSPKDCNILEVNRYMQARLESLMQPNMNAFMSPPKDPFYVNEAFNSYMKLINELIVLTEPKRTKNKEDEEKVLSTLEKIKQDFDHSLSFDESKDPYIHFILARFYAHKAISQKEYLKDSQKHYLLALQYGQGVIGYNLKSVIDEGMIISAQITRLEELDFANTKAPFTKFYHTAFCLGLITSTKEKIKQYFMGDFKNKFDIIFKHSYDGKTTQTPLITPNLSVANIDEIKNIKIDFKKPNKWIKHPYPHPITQLMHCCQIQDLESVKKLLESGADVNLLKKSDNASVLKYMLCQNLARHQTCNFTSLNFSSQK